MNTPIQGRLTVMTTATVQKLEQSLHDGFCIERACQLSGISRSTFYSHLAADPDFSDRIALAQSWATERANQVVIKAIGQGDLKAAQWWLERKARNEFATNLPTHFERDNASMVDRYYDGDTHKMIEHLSKMLEAFDVPNP